jgi:hypothetical protein
MTPYIEAGHGIERRRAFGFAGTQAESGMMKGTPDRLAPRSQDQYRRFLKVF